MGFTIAEMSLAGPLEREAELKQLSELLGAAQSGRRHVCVVEGPSGVGKSRLLDECAGTARALGLSVLRARGSELTRDHAFSVVRTLLEPTLVRADEHTRAQLMHGPAGLAEPVRPALSGVESLTPSELRTARLAAQGVSNSDIAEMIFVSRNTVAWHLRNVYRKLQIGSREQLTLVET